MKSWYKHKRPRWMRWEFMPTWLFYLPLLPMFVYVVLRARSLTWFTVVNPRWYLGGFVGESKIEVQESFTNHEEIFPKTLFLAQNTSKESALSQINTFMQRYQLTYPIMYKPNVGEKGNGIVKVRSAEQWREVLPDSLAEDRLIQEFIALEDELGVFVIKEPKTDIPYIFSITHKTILSIEGDGNQNIQSLIESHPRAWLMKKFFFEKHAAKLQDVLPKGQVMEIGDLGNHCKGALFEDGMLYKTPALQRYVEYLCQHNPDFNYGRMDVKMDNILAPTQFKLIEINGTTSESTNMYDPKFTLFKAYRIATAHWTAQARIARKQIKAGKRPEPFFKTLRTIVGHVRAIKS